MFYYSLLILVLISLSLTISDPLREQLCGSDSPDDYPSVTLKNAVLIQSQIVIRHGDRTPWQGNLCWPSASSTFDCTLTDTSLPDHKPLVSSETLSRLYRKPIIPNRNYYPGNCLTGQLTSRGYNQHVSNGKKFAKAYTSSLLSSSYVEEEVYLRSDNEERTVQSAQALFLGLYDKSSTSETQVVDIHTMDRHNDDMTINSYLCPVVSDFSDEAVKSPRYLYHRKTVMEPLYERMSELYQTTVTDDNFNDLLDCSVVYYCHNMSLPQGVDGDFILEMNEAQAWQWAYVYAYPTIDIGARVGIGFLIQDIYIAMKEAVQNYPSNSDIILTQKNAKINNNNHTNFVLYSGHDTTIKPLLVAYRVDDAYLPHYASTLFFEVFYVNNEGFKVRLVYNQNELLIPGCDSVYCDFDLFASVTENLLPNPDACE